MKFENTRVMGFEGALRGMRNPMNSWNKSDSYFGIINPEYDEIDYQMADAWIIKKYPIPEEEDPYEHMPDEWERIDKWLLDNGILQENSKKCPTAVEVAFIGPNDMDLAQRLIRAGSEHRKFMRQISVSVDITAPLYW